MVILDMVGNYYGKKNVGKHPSLIVGESNDKTKFINIGLTHSKKRGHHVNVEIYDPNDYPKVNKIINKHKKKNSH